MPAMFRFAIEPMSDEHGGKFEVDAWSVDVVAWEALPAKPGQVRSVGVLEQHKRMTDLSELAWCAARRADATRGLDLRTWLRSMNVGTVPKGDPDEDVEALDPTRPAP